MYTGNCFLDQCSLRSIWLSAEKELIMNDHDRANDDYMQHDIDCLINPFMPFDMFFLLTIRKL